MIIMKNTQTDVIDVASEAVTYLKDLLAKQEGVLGVYLTVDKPGTAFARTLLSYCREDLDDDQAEKTQFDGLQFYIDRDSLDYIKDTEIGFEQNSLGGDLTVKSPNVKTPVLPENASLEEKVEHVLAMFINPMLAAHGGAAHLAEVKNGNEAIITFSGGCQGCAVVPVTMKHMIEKQLKENVPEIESVTDITDHSNNENAYYK